MKLIDFINSYLGKGIDFDGYYGNQCVDLFRKYCQDVLEISQPKSGNAKDFWNNYETDDILKNNFDKIINTPEFVPQAGDIAIWNKNIGKGNGHISICTGDNSNTKIFESFDQNWGTKFCRKVTHSYVNFYGVLRPKDQSKIKNNIRDHYETQVSNLRYRTDHNLNDDNNIKGKFSNINTPLDIIDYFTYVDQHWGFVDGYGWSMIYDACGTYMKKV